jgi:outer membrane protein assembly factor BamB
MKTTPSSRLCGLAVGCAILFSSLIARADDWAQWRGPERDGKSKETGLLKKWPEEGPKLVWQKNDIGMGYSTPSVVGERLYLMSNEGSDAEFVKAFQVADGKPVWSQRIGKVGPNTPAMNYPGARSTPTVDGDSIFVLGSDGDLACLETATGKPKWQKNLRTDFGGAPGEWAYAESPLVDGDHLIVTPGGKSATIACLSKKTGDTVWTCATPGGDTAGYASAIAIEAGGVKQYVQFLQKGLVGVEAGSGKLLWTYADTAKGSPANIPTPVASGDFVYSAAGRSGGGLIHLKNDNGKFVVEQVYFGNKMPVAIGGSVLIDDHLYGTSQVLMCMDFKTGKPKWTDRSVGTASVLFADGMLYLHGENGDVALVEATPSGYHEHGKFTPPDAPDRGRSKAWAYPVVANGKLYIRDMNMLWCYDVKNVK